MNFSCGLVHWLLFSLSLKLEIVGNGKHGESEDVLCLSLMVFNSCNGCHFNSGEVIAVL